MSVEWGSRLKSRRSFYNIEREVISKDNFHEQEDKDKHFAGLQDEVTDKKLRQVWSDLSGLWLVHSKMAKWEEPFDERRWGLLPRSKESGESVLARHDIGAYCCKGCKDSEDLTPGQDNFSCSRLAGGFRLHCIADGLPAAAVPRRSGHRLEMRFRTDAGRSHFSLRGGWHQFALCGHHCYLHLAANPQLGGLGRLCGRFSGHSFVRRWTSDVFND